MHDEFRRLAAEDLCSPQTQPERLGDIVFQLLVSRGLVQSAPTERRTAEPSREPAHPSFKHAAAL